MVVPILRKYTFKYLGAKGHMYVADSKMIQKINFYIHPYLYTPYLYMNIYIWRWERGREREEKRIKQMG